MSSQRERSIAIVGIGCRFPGGVSDVEQLWSMLREGRQGVGDIPADRIDLKRYYDAAPQTPGKTSARYGGYLQDIDLFDAEFFGISPREAERIDPQQRLLLETAWEALEDAGADLAKLERTRVGVFVGQWLSDFEQRLFLHPDEVDFYMTTGSGRYAASGRIAYAFGFMGPSLTLDTACSSSLSAVHLAVQSLRSGESSVALAGGANVILAPHIHIAYSQSGMMAADGRCKFGDARADGYVRSEGAAILVLKRLEDAVRDGDRIHAVVRGSAINNDGQTSGSMGTPSQAGQQDLLVCALRDAGVDPLEIGYVEAHGTGTRAGDKVEIGALAAVLGENRAPEAPLIVGSVKTNLGHTEGAAGAAGLIKAVLAVREGCIPASLNLETPSPDVPWGAAPLAVPRDATPWAPPAGAPRRAGVSAFGIAGANAHVIIESAPEPAAAAAAAPSAPLLTLSARSQGALRALAGRVAAKLAGPQPPALADLIGFSQTRRSALSHRAAFLAEDAAALEAALRAFAEGGAAFAEGVADPRRPAKVALVFPGQGGQWNGMARELLATEPAFRASLERADAAIRAEAGWSLLEQLALDPDAAAYLGERIDIIQPALAAVSIAYADWLKDRGLAIDAVVGHSMGEAAAAYVAGALSLEDAMRVLCRRSALMGAKSGEGAMALVDLPQAEAAAGLAGFEGKVSVAAINSPRSCVISGDRAAVTELTAQFEKRGVFSRLVKVDVASHSHHMDEPARALQGQLDGLTPRPEGVAFVSAVLGQMAAGGRLDAGYWAKNLREPVRFADAVDVLAQRGVTAFVEAGPHPVLAPSIEQHPQPEGRPFTIVGCGRRGEPERAVLLSVLAQLWCAGAQVDWARGGSVPARIVEFPLYPWQRRRFWVETAEIARSRGAGPARRGLDEETREWMHKVAWRELPAAKPPERAGRWLVLGEADGLADALRRAGAAVEARSLDELEARLAGVETRGAPLNVVVAAAPGADAPFLPARASQALPRAAQVRLWFVTHGAQGPGEPARRDIDQAALWGAARVLSDEQPELWGGLLDLARHGANTRDAEAAAARLLSPGGEDQLAVRDGAVFAPRLVPAAEAAGAAVEWRADGAYLLTGGLGDAGLAVARAMVQEGARRLILLGRTPLPDRRTWAALDPASTAGRRVAAIRELESLGAAIQAPVVDISNEAAVADFLADYAAEGWPPIRGVVHLAGVLNRGLVATLTREAFDEAIAAKLRGAQILDRLLPDLDSFVMFSSTTTLMPQPGVAAYVAANAGLDALAADRRARGEAAMSIAWGQWRGGMLGDAQGVALIADQAKLGIGSFSLERGASLFGWAAGRDAPAIAVAPVDWAAYAKGRGRTDPLLSELSTAADVGSLAERVAEAKGPARRALLAQVVADSLARTLQSPPEAIDHAKEFGAMGLTSLLAMELRNRLERLLAIPLPATLAWNYPTVAALAEHLSGDAAQVDGPARCEEVVTAAAPPVGVAARIAAVAELTEADALNALLRRRRSTPS